MERARARAPPCGRVCGHVRRCGHGKRRQDGSSPLVCVSRVCVRPLVWCTARALSSADNVTPSLPQTT
eukprot:2393127-Prymnesium_polylepis.1